MAAKPHEEQHSPTQQMTPDEFMAAANKKHDFGQHEVSGKDQAMQDAKQDVKAGAAFAAGGLPGLATHEAVGFVFDKEQRDHRLGIVERAHDALNGKAHEDK